VTKFSYKTIPQGQVWVSNSAFPGTIISSCSISTSGKGGTRNHTADQLDAVKDAIIKFQEKKDTKAVLALVIIHTPKGVGCHDVFVMIPT
jgi:hypothetical protein